MELGNMKQIEGRSVTDNDQVIGKRAVTLALHWRRGGRSLSVRCVWWNVELDSLLRAVRPIQVAKDADVRVAKIGVSSHLVKAKRLFVTVHNARASKRTCVPTTVSGKTITMLYRRLPRRLGTNVACVRIGSDRSTMKGITAAFCNSPASGVRLVNIAKAGKGAAITALLCGAFHCFNCGIKLISAMYGCVSSLPMPARRAAPSPVALGHLLKRVTSSNYGCTFVRIDSRSVTRGHVDNLGFTNNVFAGLAHSRLSCRGAIRGCLGTGGGFFSRLPGKTFDLAGLSSGGKLIVARGAHSGMCACSLHDLDSFGNGILRSRFRKVLLSFGGRRLTMHFVKGFGTCGLLTMFNATMLLNGGRRSMLITLDALRPMANHFSTVHSPGNCATVISCTRAPSTLIGMLGTVRKILRKGKGIVAIINTNNGHSGNGHPVVTGRSTHLDSQIVVASSGPHFRRPRSVVGSVLTKLSGSSVRGAVDVASHHRTVGATYVLTRPKSIVLITNGKRRGCRRVGNIGRRFSSGRVLGRVVY